MAIVLVGNVEVVVRTRDEHCPPHVHADCAADGWDARFRFSFLDEEVAFWDVRPRRNAPGVATLNRVGAAVLANLPRCRERWWTARRTTCLENLYVLPRNGRLVPGGARVPGAAQVAAAVYDPSTRTTTVTLTDGTARSLAL